ncbi:hypothetical protein [uncultured Gammaproteobacteria bacterium]|nr:hypothetical protein [uncultured Gammaproteobacteria bacterium]CAC9632514.1 hypothetical protein [uncultured Gammaproteobacteria bacterium]
MLVYDYQSITTEWLNFVQTQLVLLGQRFKEITNWAKIGFCQSPLFMQRFLIIKNQA